MTINARIAPVNSSTQNAKNTKFYLLENDVQALLSEARVQPIEGNDLMSSLGLAIVFPDHYGDFLRIAMRAVGANSKYSGTTDRAEIPACKV